MAHGSNQAETPLFEMLMTESAAIESVCIKGDSSHNDITQK